MTDWIYGPTVALADLPRPVAIAIFGLPLVEAVERARQQPLAHEAGTYRVAAVDWDAKTVTLRFDPF